MAAETLEHMGVSGPTADLALFLVAEHLLLSDTATRRDLEDEDLVLGVADRIGDPTRLAALYLVTIADAEATGPLAWTPWRATLVRELVVKVQHVLERGDVGPGTAERLSARAEAIRAALGREAPDVVERFLLRMPRGYVLSVPLERVASHVPAGRPAGRGSRGADPRVRGHPCGHLRARGRGGRPAGPALDDRRGALARGSVRS